MIPERPSVLTVGGCFIDTERRHQHAVARSYTSVAAPPGDRFIFLAFEQWCVGTGKHLGVLRAEVYERWHFRGLLPRETQLSSHVNPPPQQYTPSATFNLSKDPQGAGKTGGKGWLWSYWQRSESTLSEDIGNNAISSCLYFVVKWIADNCSTHVRILLLNCSKLNQKVCLQGAMDRWTGYG